MSRRAAVHAEPSNGGSPNGLLPSVNLGVVDAGASHHESWSGTYGGPAAPTSITARLASPVRIGALFFQASHSKAELTAPPPGTPTWIAIANRLSEVVMIQVLRAWIKRQPQAVGALQALHDARISKALEAIHNRPEEPWTVQSLAVTAGMSRTSFSTLFSELMGTTPMQYLTSWRMEVARSLLHAQFLTLSEVAERVGYGSQASFTKVFREAVGMTPGAYRDAVVTLG